MRVVTRGDLERFEHLHLSPDATFSDASRGRERKEVPDPLRTCFQQDRDRILHSKSFRRLANKTQVFLAPEGDHYRTRLTHTLEVSQVACAIARSLGLNVDLTEAIALGHDLGHTPFGHAGERALRKARALYRGIEPLSEEADDLFRHNVQSVRIVRQLEKEGRGLNLTLEVMDGICCHTGPLQAFTPEGRIVARADRIAYITHDIDDAERAGLLTEEDLPLEAREVLGRSSSQRIETMIQDVVHTSAEEGDIAMSERVYHAASRLRTFLYENLYEQGDAKSEEPKAERVVMSLFTYFVTHMDEVPKEYRLHDDAPDVQVADYLSSMTDRYAIRVYEALNVPRGWGLRS
jgi:dGTPase